MFFHVERKIKFESICENIRCNYLICTKVRMTIQLTNHGNLMVIAVINTPISSSSLACVLKHFRKCIFFLPVSARTRSGGYGGNGPALLSHFELRYCEIPRAWLIETLASDYQIPMPSTEALLISEPITQFSH